jgi:hypothetical protein
MGNDLIYRCDCDLFSPSAGTEEMIRDLMDEYGLTWEKNIEDNNFDEDKIYDFACELIQKCQNYIDSAETITADEYFAFKYPECHTLYIEEEENLYSSICRTCGI